MKRCKMQNGVKSRCILKQDSYYFTQAEVEAELISGSDKKNFPGKK